MLVRNLLMSALLLSGRASAQSLSEATLSDWSSSILNYTKTHFSASYHGEVYGVRRDVENEDTSKRNINDLKIMHNPTLIYKPTENWQVLSTAEFKFSDQPNDKAGADYPNSFYTGQLTLTRKNILTEKENGLQLDAGIGRRQFNTGSNQRTDGSYPLASYGYNHAFTTVSKILGKASTSLYLQYLNNDYKVATAKTWKHRVEVVPTINVPITSQLSYLFNDDITIKTPKYNDTARSLMVVHDMNVGVLTYQFNDKVSSYYQLKYLHTENFTRDFQSEVDSFSNYIGTSYSFNPKSTVTLETGTELAHARDGRKGFSKNVIYPELALYLDFAI